MGRAFDKGANIFDTPNRSPWAKLHRPWEPPDLDASPPSGLADGKYLQDGWEPDETGFRENMVVHFSSPSVVLNLGEPMQCHFGLGRIRLGENRIRFGRSNRPANLVAVRMLPSATCGQYRRP